VGGKVPDVEILEVEGLVVLLRREDLSRCQLDEHRFGPLPGLRDPLALPDEVEVGQDDSQGRTGAVLLLSLVEGNRGGGDEYRADKAHRESDADRPLRALRRHFSASFS
jgi:hypothetical protein